MQARGSGHRRGKILASPQHARRSRLVTVQDAIGAYSKGDFELCNRLCASVQRRDTETRRHVALLRARALLRLDRPADALRLIEEQSFASDDGDEALVADMLEATALVRCGRYEAGAALLEQTRVRAERARSPVYPEIALALALACYAKRDLSGAEHALESIDTGADSVHPRALEYRGWIAIARGDTEQAARQFISALESLDRCRHSDRYVEANCLRALAHLATERLDERAWRIVEERRERLDWSASGLAEPHFWIAYCAATYLMDCRGDERGAAREARRAERIAPSLAYEVQAKCQRASIAHRAGDTLSSHDHAEGAAELFERLSTTDLASDEKIIPLLLAEAFANLDRFDEGNVYLERYLAAPLVSHTLSATAAAQTGALQRLTEARLSESGGASPVATTAYREAIQVYTRIGYKRRAVMATLRLAQLSGDGALYDYANAETRHLAPQSWIRRAIAAAHDRPVQLTKNQQEIVGLICQGKSTPEIAKRRGRSEFTIRNHLTKIFERLGVNTREEVAVEAILRGYWKPHGDDPDRLNGATR